MPTTTHKNFNPVYEAASLIRLALFPEARNPASFLEDTDSLIDRSSIYKHFETNYQTYINTFINNFVPTPYTNLFFYEKKEFGVAVISVLAKNLDWLNGIDDLTDDELREIMIWHITGKKVVKKVDFIIDLIEETIEDSKTIIPDAFEIVLIYQYPKKYISRLIEIINLNLPALALATETLDENLKNKLKAFEAPRHEYIEQFFNLFTHDLHGADYEIYPTFVNPFGMTMTQGCPLFCGLYLLDELDRNVRREKPKDMLSKMFKMLSDPNKFEILTMLKNGPMYNLQIANALGITPATTNHHMSALLTQQMVRSEKRDGKVFYTLESNQLDELIADLQSLF